MGGIKDNCLLIQTVFFLVFGLSCPLKHLAWNTLLEEANQAQVSQSKGD